jgi:hypothetical protein
MMAGDGTDFKESAMKSICITHQLRRCSSWPTKKTKTKKTRKSESMYGGVRANENEPLTFLRVLQ